MRSPERSRRIIKKVARLAVPITAAILSGCATVDSGIPACSDDPQPKTKIVTLFPNRERLSVDGVIVEAVQPAGTINTFNRADDHMGIKRKKHELKYLPDGYVVFEGLTNGRTYSIKPERDLDPRYTGRDATKVTIQADCKTPKTNL